MSELRSHTHTQAAFSVCREFPNELKKKLTNKIKQNDELNSVIMHWRTNEKMENEWAYDDTESTRFQANEKHVCDVTLCFHFFDMQN